MGNENQPQNVKCIANEQHFRSTHYAIRHPPILIGWLDIIHLPHLTIDIKVVCNGVHKQTHTLSTWYLCTIGHTAIFKKCALLLCPSFDLCSIEYAFYTSYTAAVFFCGCLLLSHGRYHVNSLSIHRYTCIFGWVTVMCDLFNWLTVCCTACIHSTAATRARNNSNRCVSVCVWRCVLKHILECIVEPFACILLCCKRNLHIWTGCCDRFNSARWPSEKQFRNVFVAVWCVDMLLCACVRIDELKHVLSSWSRRFH